MNKKGPQRTVDSVPPPGKRPGPDWDGMAMVAQIAGKPVLAATNVTMSRIKSVRSYRRPPFLTDEGKIIINMRNSHQDKHGTTLGDVYFTWKTWDEINNEQKEA